IPLTVRSMVSMRSAAGTGALLTKSDTWYPSSSVAKRILITFAWSFSLYVETTPFTFTIFPEMNVS
ncbi:hypothetical protein ABLT31_37160, partial [Ammoniphilus sp. 3BR4]